MPSTQTTKKAFKAEVKQLLHLLAHSMYSNPDVFLRELISNSSDALDKLKFLSLESDVLSDDNELGVHIEADKDHKTLTIKDNGIGMTSEDAENNLGVIARSGTRAFIDQLAKAKDDTKHDLIGQFGVGFYSCFVVAESVTVLTRKVDSDADKGVKWTSTGDGEYSIEECELDQRGTSIILKLKEEHQSYLEDWKLRKIISTYSDHIGYPVSLRVEVKDEEKKETEIKDEVINQAKALWTLPKKDIAKEQYQEFYKHISHDFEEPLSWSHNQVEGKYMYTTLLYMPKRAPMDLFYREHKGGLKLFVQRVFIMDEADAFLPGYLRFMKGVVDSADLPLNVSREILQTNEVTKSIKASCTSRGLKMLEDMAKNNTEDYASFYEQFGNVIKEGPSEDFENVDRIYELLRFASTHQSDSKPSVALKDYADRMKKDQDKIYYIIADSYQAASSHPALEVFKQKGYEVLLMSDRVDEWLMSRLTEYAGKKFQNITKGELDLDKPAQEEGKEEAKEEPKEPEMTEAEKSLCERMKTLFGDKVKSVRTTKRLISSPCCVVADDNDMSNNLRRVLQEAGQVLPNQQPIFEVNAEHPLVKRIESMDDDRFQKYSNMLLSQAMLIDSGKLDDPAAFIATINELLTEV
ncbi:MAG TPA: molecular chaperone HtpG [Gammaproteobacteria bacterium]|nr:molecular chaperone HtpG [Gammaproteobacteria bacterium]